MTINTAKYIYIYIYVCPWFILLNQVVHMKILSKNTSLLPPESMIPPFHILFIPLFHFLPLLVLFHSFLLHSFIFYYILLHFVSFCFISSSFRLHFVFISSSFRLHFASFRIISHHFASFRIISHHFASFRFISYFSRTPELVCFCIQAVYLAIAFHYDVLKGLNDTFVVVVVGARSWSRLAFFRNRGWLLALFSLFF